MSMEIKRTRGRPKNVTGERAYRHLGDLVLDMADSIRPPERTTVSQAAEKYRYLNNPGAYVGWWKNETTPYMVEPADQLTNRKVNAVVFVGPAQSAKTDALIVNNILYSVVCDPMDMLVYQTSQTMARDFSRRRIDRLHRHSTAVGDRLLAGGNDDNTFDKFYRSGMILTLSWPTINELSGRPVGRVILTDYDRMPMNVDGEGSPFDLARKRTTTFRSNGKTVVESSPGFEITDPQWIPRTPHEAPPCEGILALYNRGDRRRWYWKCPHCGNWFEPSFDLLIYPKKANPVEAGERAAIGCPHCFPETGALITSDMKYDLNKNGIWIPDGQRMTRDDQLVGEPAYSDIASYWVKGPAAAFASWASLVTRYIMAEQEFERTGSQEALKSTVNTDQGEPYRRRGSETTRLPEELKTRAEPLPQRTVPDNTRFLIALVDVQKHRFVVQVTGVQPGKPYDLVIIDRFEIIKSERKDADGDTEWISPHAYPEDWDQLKKQVMDKEYPLEDGSGFMMVKMTFCDSGGRDGVTTNAYNYWLKLRAAGDGDHARFMLVKGDSTIGAPRARVSYPDAQRKDKKAVARGEVPVLMLNPNMLKDALDGMLNKTEPGGGMIRWPDWLPDEFFKELCVEQRTNKGWTNELKKRNEAWDLLYYAIGACVHLGVERWDWSEPPTWAEEWPSNTLVRAPEGTRPFSMRSDQKLDLAKIAQSLA